MDREDCTLFMFSGILWVVSLVVHYKGFYEMMSTNFMPISYGCVGLFSFLLIYSNVLLVLKNNTQTRLNKQNANMILNTQECKDFVKTNVIILKPKYFSSDALIAFKPLEDIS